MRKLPTTLLAFSLLAAAGCGDDESNPGDPDASPDPDADLTTPDAEPEPDADVEQLPDPTPQIVRLSMTGADGFNGVAATTDGGFVAVGYTSASATDRATVIAKFTAAGALDTTFGNAGVFVHNFTVGGGTAEVGRAIAVQPSGKIVAVSLIETDIAAIGPAASDRDVGILRLTADGGLDPTFDLDGVRTLSFNAGLDNNGTWAGADDIRDVEVDASGRIMLFGGARTFETTGAPRYDSDWFAMRFTVDGMIDYAFNAAVTPGYFTLDILDGNAFVRSGAILADGSILGTGYSNTTAFGSIQPVIYKLDADGALVTTWGTSGFFHEQIMLHTTELYGVVAQGDKLVTQSYGKDAEADTNDWVSLRINADGTLDTSWGDDGRVRIDFHGFADNGRAAVALPGGSTMLVGSGDTAVGARDAEVVVLDDAGAYDTAFRGDGRLTYDLGASTDGFWGAAVAADGDTVMLVGTRGVGTTQTEVANDDAVIMVVPL